MNGALDEATLPPDVVRLFAHLSPHVAHSAVARSWGAASRTGVRRQRNEDVWDQREGRTFVVADGMGGRPGGAEAAAAAVSSVLGSLDRDPPVEWPSVVGEMNRAVRAQGKRDGVPRNGAALAVVHLTGPRATVLHLGDVRLYRWRGGSLEQLTVDHTVAQELRRANVEAAPLRLRAAELAALTVYLGDETSALGYSVRTIGIVADDRLILCTDGVHQHLDIAAWHAIERLTDEDAAGALVDQAQRAGGTDDATALVITLDVIEDRKTGEL